MAKRHLGQVFLYDPSILRRIVQTAQLSKEDLVVEIGPGLGRLTKMLAERAKNVMAIELDEKLFEELRVQLADYKNIELICGDALKYPYENLPEFKVVVNIPYYITTPVIFRLLFGNQTFGITSGTLNCEKFKEFAYNEKVNTFVADNMDNLAKDIACGQGEYVDTLAVLMEVPDSKNACFRSHLQAHFSDIYTSDKVTNAEVVRNIMVVAEAL